MEDIRAILTQVLDADQMEEYDGAMAFLQEALPAPSEGGYRPYIRENIAFQNRLNQMKVQLQYLMLRKRTAMYKQEAELKGQAKDDKYAAGERSAYCFTDSKYAELREEMDLYETVHERLGSMEWLLKSLVNKI